MTVPSPIPLLIRAGTGTECPGDFAKSLRGASFGVQGAFVAPLLFPLPFRLPRPTARYFSLGQDARSGSLSRKGKGCAPCTPARCGSPDAVASERWPHSTNSFPAAIQGGVAGDFWNVSEETVLFVSPKPYGHRENQERNRGCVRITCELSATAILQRQSAIRCVRGCIRNCFGTRLFLNGNVNGIPGLLSLTTAQFSLFLRFPVFGRVAQLCLKQPRVPAIRVSGTVDYLFPPSAMSKKPITPEEMDATAEKRTPVKVIRIDDVSASIFAREHQVQGGSRTFYSVSFSRSYKDSAGVWRYAKSFDLEDLGKIITLCQQADEFIRGELNEVQEAA